MTFTRINTLLAAVILLLSACKKDRGFGSDLLPGENPFDLIYDESTELTVSTIYESPLRTDRMLFNYLGHLENAVFGKNTASNTIQFGLPTAVPSADLGPFTVKDVNLYLFYDNTFGDTIQPVSWDVYPLTQVQDTSIIRKSDYVPAYGIFKLGGISNYFVQPNTPQRLTDKDTTAGTTGFIKFPLDQGLGTTLISYINTPTITSDSLFRIQFPGVYIQPAISQPGNVMIQLDLTNTAGGIYINMIDKNGETQTMFVPIYNSTFLHTGFKHDYNGTTVANAISQGSLAGDLTGYIQSQAGVKTEIQFNGGLEKFKGKLINKAVVEVFEIQAPDNGNQRVRNIYPLKKGASGENVTLKDYSSDLFGPAYIDSSKTDNSGKKIIRYEVNITNLIKNIALGKDTDNGIYLTNYPVFDETPTFILSESAIQSQHIEPATLIFAGPKNSDESKRMKLKIWYTNPK